MLPFCLLLEFYHFKIPLNSVFRAGAPSHICTRLYQRALSLHPGFNAPKTTVIGLKCFLSLYQNENMCSQTTERGLFLYQPLLQIYIQKWRVELGTISSCYRFKTPDEICRLKSLFRSGHFTSGGRKTTKNKKTTQFLPCTVLYSVGSVARKLKFTGNPLTLISICCLIPTTHKNTSWE